MTNYEKLKQMSIEEMAEFLADTICEEAGFFCDYGEESNCDDCIAKTNNMQKWLKSEAET